MGEPMGEPASEPESVESFMVSADSDETSGPHPQVATHHEFMSPVVDNPSGRHDRDSGRIDSQRFDGGRSGSHRIDTRRREVSSPHVEVAPKRELSHPRIELPRRDTSNPRIAVGSGPNVTKSVFDEVPESTVKPRPRRMSTEFPRVHPSLRGTLNDDSESELDVPTFLRRQQPR
jgi:hypothetical protein